MSDPVIDRWKQRGSIFLWQVPGQSRNYPGWHCTADKEGCLSLLDLLGHMLETEWTAKREIVLADPTEVVTLPGGANTDAWRSPKTVTIHYPKDKIPDNFWKWEGSLDRPLLKLGRAKIAELVASLESVRMGIGDFCIHADGQKLHGFDFEKMSICFW